MTENAVSLYVHVPFCRKKCDYCDFFSLGRASCADSDRLKAEYVDSVINEVHFYAQYYSVSRWKTVYIGGGTPSQLSCAELERLLRGIFAAAPAASDAEITLEVNPDDVTEDLLTSSARAGVNRISMGIQAFDQQALDAVRRGATAASAVRALGLLQTHWRGHLSCDLIAGLPRHTAASFVDGIRMLASFARVDHISLYTLTVEDGTPLAHNIARGTVRWSPEKADRLWLRGRALLERLGFAQYEVSNFARAGCESRHNSAYWRLQNYLGCGAGASGTVYGARAHGAAVCGDGTRWTNTTDVAAYIAFWKQAVPRAENAAVSPPFPPIQTLPREVETLDNATQEFEFLMLGFRTVQGVSAADFYARFGTSLADRIGAENGVFAAWKARGLARQWRTGKKDGADTRYALNRRGLLLLNRFLEDLIA